MQGYAHLTQGGRYHIELTCMKGVSIRRIAESMNQLPSTVNCKLGRNAGQRGYRHKQAERKAWEWLRVKPTRLGGWEVDTVIGKGHRGALVTVVERSTRFMLAHPIRRRTEEETSDALLRMLLPLSEWVHTITYDDGREFSGHMHVAAELDCDDHFA